VLAEGKAVGSIVPDLISFKTFLPIEIQESFFPWLKILFVFPESQFYLFSRPVFLILGYALQVIVVISS
jgi:hypothetical protein